MDFFLLTLAVVFCMFMSIRVLFLPAEAGKQHKISFGHFLWLACLYGTICIGFALIYLLFEIQDVSVMLDHGLRIGGHF